MPPIHSLLIASTRSKKPPSAVDNLHPTLHSFLVTKLKNVFNHCTAIFPWHKSHLSVICHLPDFISSLKLSVCESRPNQSTPARSDVVRKKCKTRKADLMSTIANIRCVWLNIYANSRWQDDLKSTLSSFRCWKSTERNACHKSPAKSAFVS